MTIAGAAPSGRARITAWFRSDVTRAPESVWFVKPLCEGGVKLNVANGVEKKKSV